MVIVDGPSPEWIDVARRGRLVENGAERRVRVLFGPSGGGPEAADRAVDQARPWVGRAASGVLPLLGVERLDGRCAWIYPWVDGIACVHLGRADGAGVAPPRVAAGVVAGVASTLSRLGALHPGPEPYDVWLEEGGEVSLCGFVGPYPRGPELRAPVAAAGEAGQVYRLGVLLARLLTGAAPAPGNDPEHHRAILRRLAIRAMSARGDLPERLREHLQAMLAWDPDQRPPLSAVADGLRAAAPIGADLPTWAGNQVPQLFLATTRLPSVEPASDLGDMVDELPVSTSDAVEGEPPAEGTVPRGAGWALRSLDEDDRTAESVPASVYDSGVRAAIRERGIIPVEVGPPAQAAARSRPTLPADLVRTTMGDRGVPGLRPSARAIALVVAGTFVLAAFYAIILYFSVV